MEWWLAILRPFQQYFSHIRTIDGCKWKAVCNWTPFTVEKFSPRAGPELGSAKSVGQRLTYWATGAPHDFGGLSTATKMSWEHWAYKIFDFKVDFTKQYDKNNAKQDQPVSLGTVASDTAFHITLTEKKRENLILLNWLKTKYDYTVSFTCNIHFLNSTYFIFNQFKSNKFSHFFFFFFFCSWV